MLVEARGKQIAVLKNISKSYRDMLALDNVSFNVREGEIFGYIGPNGAGKTTTIKLIVGLISDFEGSLNIGGFPMPQQRDDVHKILGYLPQKVAFQEWRTVDHALVTFGRLSGLEKKELENRIKNVLDMLDISGMRHKRIVDLSGGMIQKVGLAQALLHNPKLLVLDEPLAGLDPASRYQVKRTIRDLGNNGTTVFFSSHILSDVQDVAHRIGILNNGHMINIGSVDELKANFASAHEIDIVLSSGIEGCKNLQALEGIASVTVPSTNRLLVQLERGVDLEEIINLLIQKLLDLGCRIRSINPITPSLDEIYIRYVEGGRSL